MPPTAPTAQPGREISVGELLRDWRSRRRHSQMELALRVGVSTRHLSFIETGSGDRTLIALEQEVLAYPNVAGLASNAAADALDEAPLLVPCVLRLPQGQLSMFTTLTTFGTPRDITLDELSVELFYPADENTEALLRALHVALPR